MVQSGRVQTYFQHHARQFDHLYRCAGATRFFNRWARAPLYRRFELTLAACGDVRGKRVLDVGCGSGRYAVALAERGAFVVGMDFAGNMLVLAQELAQECGVTSQCHFVQADFLEYSFEEKFDIALAIGLFDYTPNPPIFLQKLRSLADGKVIVSFSPPGGWRALQRRLRYDLQGCPLFFHSREDMDRYLADAGFRTWRFVGSWAEALITESGTPSSTKKEECDAFPQN